MLSVKTSQEALEIIMERFSIYKMPSVAVPLMEAVGHILFKDILSEEYVPGFNRSAVDGYAVAADDTFGCSDSLPAILTLTGEVLMGKPAGKAISRGQCVYVPTGGELPEGSDAMVMLEYTEDYSDGTIGILKPSAPGAHIIFRGDDAKPGDLILKAGKRLKASDIGSLAALGRQSVNVFKPPAVAIISTGDEVMDIDEPVSGARVRDVNSYVLDAGLRALGCEPVRYGIIPDDYERLHAVVKNAAEHSDMVLISGGSSVGARDCTLRAIEALGQVLFHGISIKPGKPTILGEINNVPVFGLPGHPVAVYFIYNLFVKPLLAAMMGETLKDTVITLPAASAIPSNHGREECVPVRIEDGKAVPIIGKSGLITILSRADGYIRIPRDTEGISRGDEVSVILF